MSDLLLLARDVIPRHIEFVRSSRPELVDRPKWCKDLNPRKFDHTSSAAEGDTEGGQEEDTESVSSCDSDDPRRHRPSHVLSTPNSVVPTWTKTLPIGAGLRNLGNTCYMNSVLQCLTYAPALFNYLETLTTPNAASGGFDAAFALARVVKAIQLKQQKVVVANEIVTHLRSLSKTFRSGRQEDAHEFMIGLMDACQQSVLWRFVRDKKLDPRSAHTSPLMRVIGGYLRSRVSWAARHDVDRRKQQQQQGRRSQGRNSWQQQPQHSRGSDGPAPDGEMRHSDTFETCGAVSLELSGKTLECCLEHFCCKEHLGDDVYITPSNNRVPATKHMTFHVPPQSLVLHLKRFSRSAKMGRHVAFPEVLNMSPYCSDPTQPRKYQLTGVLVHDGPTMRCGHYYSFVRGRNGLWYCADDEQIRSVNQDLVMRQQAYMLFYNRLASPTQPKSQQRKRMKREEASDDGEERGSDGGGVPAVNGYGPRPQRPLHEYLNGHSKQHEPQAEEDLGEEFDATKPPTPSRKQRRVDSGGKSPRHGRTLPPSPKHRESMPGGSPMHVPASGHFVGSKSPTLVYVNPPRSKAGSSPHQSPGLGSTPPPPTVPRAVKKELRSPSKQRPAAPGIPDVFLLPPQQRRGPGTGGESPSTWYNPQQAPPSPHALPAVVPNGTAAQGTAEVGPLPQPQQPQRLKGPPATREDGRAVKAALREGVPESLQRKPYEGSFHRRQRDPQWSAELDKGKVKKTGRRKVRNSFGGDGRNRFQEQSNIHKQRKSW